MASPTDAAILERAKSLCNEGCFTIALQHRRLRSVEPEDKVFLFRKEADLRFLILALHRLKNAAKIAERVPAAHDIMKAAIEDFDSTLPNLKDMRDVWEHIDEYAVDAPTRRRKVVDRRELQVSCWDGKVFNWLGHDLDIDVALKAAEQLFDAIKRAVNSYKESVANSQT